MAQFSRCRSHEKGVRDNLIAAAVVRPAAPRRIDLSGLRPTTGSGLFPALSAVANKISLEIPEAGPSVSLMSPDRISASKLDSFSYRNFGEVKPGIYYQSQRFGQRGIGEFFSEMKPVNSLDAEELFNIKAWGNNADQLAIFEIKPGLQAWQGGVKGGAGTQLYIPKELHADFVTQFDKEFLFGRWEHRVVPPRIRD